MRPRSPFALAGVLVILLLSVLGFAAFSATSSAPSTTPDGVVFPSDASGRIAATAIASEITGAATQQRLETQAVAEARRQAREERAAERAARQAAATSTTAAPTTTSAAAPATAPPTTDPPTTTPAPTTTTAPPPPPTTTTTTEAPPTHSGGVEAWRSVVEEYWPAGLVEDALSVMDCESGGDPYAYNSSSGASGLFQFLPGTWDSASVDAGWDGADVFDGEANIAVAAWLSESSSTPWEHWNCKP